MANTIKTNVFTDNGTVYSADVYVKHLPILNKLDQGQLIVQFSFYKDTESFTAGFTRLHPVMTLENKIPITVFTKELTMEQVMNINGLSIQSYVTEYLKGIYGEDNVEEVV